MSQPHTHTRHAGMVRLCPVAASVAALVPGAGLATAAPTPAPAAALEQMIGAPAGPGEWVIVSIGGGHLIQANLAGIDWSGPARRTALLLYLRDGSLGPAANAHFRLEQVEIDCSARTTTATSSVLAGPQLDLLASGAGRLAQEGAEPEQVWRETAETVCGLAPPRTRALLTDPRAVQALARDVQRITGAAPTAVPDFLALEARNRGGSLSPVLRVGGQFYQARDGDCGTRAGGQAVQVQGGQWSADSVSCDFTDFEREVELIATLRGPVAGSLRDAANRALTRLPPVQQPATGQASTL